MISVVTIDDPDWDFHVKKANGYDVFYLHNYVKAFQEEQPDDGDPILVIYSYGDEYGINVVFKRDIAGCEYFIGRIDSGKYYDLISPYGYGGFVGNINDYERLLEEYSSFCKANGFVSEFCRFGLFSDYYEHFLGTIQSKTHNVVRELSLPPDEMWMDFKQCVRKNVKRANKNGLEIIVDENGQHLDEFLSIYYSTMDRTNAKDAFFFSRNFFEMINNLENGHCYFHVRDPESGKIVSTELVLYGPEYSYSYLGGTLSDYFHLRPNDFLKYEIIKWSQEKGLRAFVLGGGYGEDDGIFQYKSHFAPKGIVDFYIGKQIWDIDAYKKLCDIRGVAGHLHDLENSNFFPEYRQK